MLINEVHMQVCVWSTKPSTSTVLIKGENFLFSAGQHQTQGRSKVHAPYRSKERFQEEEQWMPVKEVTAVCHLMKLNACVNVYRLQSELNFFGSKTSAT